MAKETGVERWMLERFDREEDMVRVEICPATRKGAEALVAAYERPAKSRKKAKPCREENLSWWDASGMRILEAKRNRFLNMLGLDKDVVLVEGMVLYVFFSVQGEMVKVVNATPQARELAKALYSSLLDMPAGSGRGGGA